MADGQEEEKPEKTIEPTRLQVWLAFWAGIWTLAILILVSLKTSGISQATAVIGSVGTCLTTFLGIFRPGRGDKPERLQWLTPAMLNVCVLGLLSVDLVASVGWPAWSYRQSTRNVDVTAQVEFVSSQDLQPGSSATLIVPVPADRKTLTLEFQVVDTNPAEGDCAPETKLTVTPLTGAGQDLPYQSAGSGAPVNVPLLPGQRSAKIRVTVLNENPGGDQNCAVDLAVSSAILDEN